MKEKSFDLICCGMLGFYLSSGGGRGGKKDNQMFLGLGFLTV